MPPLLNRLRRRLRRNRNRHEELTSTWSEAEPYAKEAFQQISASFVSSWEVATSALYRVGTARWEKEEAQTLANRFSDGLVPTTEGLSAVEHQLVGVWRLAAEDGDTIAERLPRLRTLLKPLGANTAAGWLKTVAYIRPILERLERSDETAVGLEALGGRIGDALDDQVAHLMQTLEALPKYPTQAAVLSTLQTFGEGACRAVELELDAVRQLIQSDE